MGVFESQKKILAGAYFNYSFAAWWTHCNNTRFCTCSIYLCYFLTYVMAKKSNPKKKKIRVPVPQKPPKVEDDKKKYNREKEKRKIRKQISNGK